MTISKVNSSVDAMASSLYWFVFIAIFLGIVWYIRECFTSRKNTDAPIQENPSISPWDHIAQLLPDMTKDLVVLRDHWSSIDKSFGKNLLISEDAIRRSLHDDLPLIAETLRDALITAQSENERRQAKARAIDAIMDLNTLMKGHLSALHSNAIDEQATIGLYLEGRLQDVVPKGHLATVIA